MAIAHQRAPLRSSRAYGESDREVRAPLHVGPLALCGVNPVTREPIGATP